MIQVAELLKADSPVAVLVEGLEDSPDHILCYMWQIHLDNAFKKLALSDLSLLFDVKRPKRISKSEETIINPSFYLFDPWLQIKGEGEVDFLIRWLVWRHLSIK